MEQSWPHCQCTAAPRFIWVGESWGPRRQGKEKRDQEVSWKRVILLGGWRTKGCALGSKGSDWGVGWSGGWSPWGILEASMEILNREVSSISHPRLCSGHIVSLSSLCPSLCLSSVPRATGIIAWEGMVVVYTGSGAVPLPIPSHDFLAFLLALQFYWIPQIRLPTTFCPSSQGAWSLPGQWRLQCEGPSPHTHSRW